MPTSLQELISVIPPATEDGHVISSDHFNTLRAAILELASRVGGTAPVTTLTFTFAPSFSPNATSPTWVQLNGLAAKPTNGTSADGWLPLQLPDGALIQSMTVIGDKSGSVGSFIVQLSRQSLSGTNLATLITISLSDAPDTYHVTNQAPSSSIIDTRTSKYLATARIIGADAASTARIFGIQIVCSRT